MRWPAGGKLRQAAGEYRRVIRECPDDFEAHARVGYVLTARGKPAEAIPCYETLAERGELANPAEDLVELGTAYLGLKNPVRAAACFQRAIEAAPELAIAHLRLGMALDQQANKEEALARYRRAVAVQPGDPQSRAALALALYSSTDRAAAANALQAAADRGVENPLVVHLLAASRGESSAAPLVGYVQTLFDEYADHFDSHLVEGLGYRTPWHLRDALKQCAGPRPQHWRVIDLGCGTGLCGSLFRPLASELVGVDLSRRMLEKARTRGIYEAYCKRT